MHKALDADHHPVVQLRKARDFQRMAEKENEGQNGGAAGYKGPDGSGQWVSMGELGSEDLDQALGGLGGGENLSGDCLPTHQ